MELSIATSQKMTQTLSMDQLQSLGILELSNYDLENHIHEKSLENPLIAVIEPQTHYLHRLVDFSTTTAPNRSTGPSTETIDYLPNSLHHKKKQHEEILEQIPLHQNLCELDRKILRYLILNLNHCYFLDIPLENVMATFDVSYEHVENLLHLLHTFEPIGIGARSAKEYLLIQIDHDLMAPPLATTFVTYHLEELATLSLRTLSKQYKISMKEVQLILKYIQTLNPAPSLTEEQRDSLYIEPEVTVRKIQEEWVIELNKKAWSTVELDQMYIELLRNDTHNKKYYNNCLKDAALLIQGLEQRDRTLYLITRVLLDVQKDFFEYGTPALKPMMMKDFAVILNMHESTISRAVRNKHLKTPHGLFSIRSLFVKGVVNQSGKMDSVMFIKKRIQEWIETEDPSTPLTDQQLTTFLQNESIQISRRTVAKYREELRIPSSSKRAYLYL